MLVLQKFIIMTRYDEIITNNFLLKSLHYIKTMFTILCFLKQSLTQRIIILTYSTDKDREMEFLRTSFRTGYGPFFASFEPLGPFWGQKCWKLIFWNQTLYIYICKAERMFKGSVMIIKIRVHIWTTIFGKYQFKNQCCLLLRKMPQSGLGSVQGKNTAKRNMSSAMWASSMNKSLDPTPI